MPATAARRSVGSLAAAVHLSHACSAQYPHPLLPPRISEGGMCAVRLHSLQNYLFSAGMDGMIKAWAVLDPPQGPGMVLRPEPELVFDKDNQEAQDAQGQQQMGGRRRVSGCRVGVSSSGGCGRQAPPLAKHVACSRSVAELCVHSGDMPTASSR